MQGYPIGLLAVDRLWITLPGTALGQRRAPEEEKNQKPLAARCYHRCNCLALSIALSIVISGNGSID